MFPVIGKTGKRDEEFFRKNKMTEGVIWRQILFFSLPLLGSSFIQQFYNTADLLFVGNMIGKKATAAVGASSLVVTCLVGFFTGLSVGVSVAVAHSIGAGDRRKIDRAVHTSMGLSLLGGALLSILGILVARVVLSRMSTPAEILDMAVSYVRIYLLSMIPLVTYNMLSGIIRACGNSCVPMVVQAVSGIVNVVMDYITIRWWHMGVEGVAWATFFSQTVAAVSCVLYLTRPSRTYRLEIRKVRLCREIVREIFRFGIPAGLQNLVITLSNIFVQCKINGLGVDAVAAFSVYFKVELFIYLPIVAFGQAMMTFAGQNAGAGRVDRINRGVGSCILLGIGYAVCSAALLLVFGRNVFALFNREPEVIDCGMRIIRVTFPFYWLYAILEVLADTIRGTGRSIPPMIIILANICALRTALLLIFTALSKSLEAVAAVYPMAWMLTVVCFLVYWFGGRKSSG